MTKTITEAMLFEKMHEMAMSKDHGTLAMVGRALKELYPVFNRLEAMEMHRGSNVGKVELAHAMAAAIILAASVAAACRKETRVQGSEILIDTFTQTVRSLALADA